MKKLIFIAAIVLLSGCAKENLCANGLLTVKGNARTATSFYWKDITGFYYIYTVNKSEIKTISLPVGTYIMQFQNIKWQVPIIRDVEITGCKENVIQF